MGVAGAGKSRIGAELARRLGAAFVEGDDVHPPENRAAMSAGRPLTDAMRAGWLDDLTAIARTEAGTGRTVVLSCSALRRSYRDRLRRAGRVVFLWLDVPEAELRRRLAGRRGHFFRPELLDSQLATLEPPQPDEADARRIRAGTSPGRVLRAALAAVAEAGAGRPPDP